MKSKHFMHWFLGGENEQIDRSESSREHYKKKKTPSWIAPNYECEWKEPLGTKKQWIQWIQRDDICYTYVSNQLCQQTALKFLPPLLQHAFHSFIHSFICAFSDFPINCKGFFVFPSISNTVNVNKPLSIFCILHGISAPDQQFGKRKMMLMEK